MIFSVLFPSECKICGEPFLFSKQNFICEDCIYSIESVKPVYCQSCGKKIFKREQLIDKYCLDCLNEKKFENLGVFTSINEEIKKVIAIYKLNSVKPLSHDIANLIRRDIKDFVESNNIDLITYVPLHKKVQKERGFNHLREILINIFDKSVVKEVIKKVRNTKLQMDLSAEERKTNLKNAFLLTDIASIIDKNVLIFDDIMTTGNTLYEVLKEIKKGKPKKVFGYVIAR